MKNIMDTILAKCRGRADSAEVIAYHNQSMPVEFRAGRLHSVEHKESLGMGLRVIKNGRIGFSSTTDPNQLDQLVANALASAEFGQMAAFQFPGKCRPRKAPVYDPRLEKYTPEQAIAEGQRNVETIRQKAPRLTLDVSLRKSVTDFHLANSQGLEANYRKSTFSHSLSGMAVTPHGLLYIGDGRNSCRLLREGPKMAAKIVKLYRNALRPAVAQTGRMPVIFSTDAAYLLWMALGMGVNGKQVQKKSSPLTGQIGERIIDKRVTVTDDPTYEYAVASGPCDDEGGVCCQDDAVRPGGAKGFRL